MPTHAFSAMLLLLRSSSLCCRLRRASASPCVTRQMAFQPDTTMIYMVRRVRGCMKRPGPHLPFPATATIDCPHLADGRYSSPPHGTARHGFASYSLNVTSSSEPYDITSRLHFVHGTYTDYPLNSPHLAPSTPNGRLSYPQAFTQPEHVSPTGAARCFSALL